MDPKARVEAVEDSNAPEEVKQEAREDYREQARAGMKNRNGSSAAVPTRSRPTTRREDTQPDDEQGTAAVRQASTNDSNSLKLVDSAGREVPFHDVTSDLRSRRGDEGETAAERRRRQALERAQEDEDSEDDGTDRVPPPRSTKPASAPLSRSVNDRNTSDAGETAAERRRREGALGIREEEEESDTEEDDQARTPNRNIRFADPPPQASSGTRTPENQPRQRQSALKWGQNVGR
jgi:hypothetical protein